MEGLAARFGAQFPRIEAPQADPELSGSILGFERPVAPHVPGRRSSDGRSGDGQRSPPIGAVLGQVDAVSPAPNGGAGGAGGTPAGLTVQYQVYAPDRARPRATRVRAERRNGTGRRRGKPGGNPTRLEPLEASRSAKRRSKADAVQRALQMTAPGGLLSQLPSRQHRGASETMFNIVDSRHGGGSGSTSLQPRGKLSASTSRLKKRMTMPKKRRTAASASTVTLRKGHRSGGGSVATSPAAGSDGGGSGGGGGDGGWRGLTVRTGGRDGVSFIPASMGGTGTNRSLSHQSTPVLAGRGAAFQPSPIAARHRAAAESGADSASLVVGGEEEYQEWANKQRNALLTEWLGSFQAEKQHYDSVSIEAEVRLRKAALFAQKLGNPNQLGTAVAFQVLDDVFAIFGRYKFLVKGVKELLLTAVYRENPDDLPEELRQLFQVNTPSQKGDDQALARTTGLRREDEERLRRYFACTPWFEQCKMLREERDSLVHLTSQLRDALVRLENEKGVTADRESAKFMALRWKNLIRQRKDRKVIDKLLAKVEEGYRKLEDMKKAPTDGMSSEDIANKMKMLFAGVSGAKEQQHIMETLSCMCPGVWENLLMYIINHESLTTKTARGLCLEMLLSRRGMHIGELQESIGDILTCPLLDDYPDGRLHLLIEAFNMAGDDRATLIAYVLESMTKAEHLASLRKLLFLSNGGTKQTRIEYTQRHVARFTAPERHILFHSVVKAMEANPDEREQLKQLLESEFLRMADSSEGTEATMAMLRKLLQRLPEGALCDLIDCQYHKHPEPGSEDGKAEEDDGASKEDAPAPPAPRVRLVLPWSKYLRPPKRKVVKVLKLRNALSLIYDMWEKKIRADATEDRARDDTQAAARGAIPSPRQHFGEFVMYFLLTKFGLPSLRDAYLYSIVDAIARYSSSKRVELFAVMCGVSMSQHYTSRISNIVLHLLRLMYPKFSAAIFRRRKEGEVFLELHKVLAAVTTVFVEQDLSFANDRLTLTDGRRQRLVEQVTRASATATQMQAQRNFAKGRGSIVGMSVAAIMAHKRRGGSSAVIDAIDDHAGSAQPHQDDGTSAGTGTGTGTGTDSSAQEPDRPLPLLQRMESRVGGRLLGSTRSLRTAMSSHSMGAAIPEDRAVTVDTSLKRSSSTTATNAARSPSSGTSSQVSSAPIGAKPFGFPPNAVIVDVDTVLWLCVHMFMDQSMANKMRMKVLYHAFDEDRSGTLSLVEFHTLLQACCPDRLSDRLIADLFEEVVGIDRDAKKQMRKARRKAGLPTEESDDEEDDSVSSEAFAMLCHKHGISPPSGETLEAGIGMVTSALDTREKDMHDVDPFDFEGEDGSKEAGDGGGVSSDDEGDDVVFAAERSTRRASLLKSLNALHAARGSLNRMIMVLQGKQTVLRAVDKLKGLRRAAPSGDGQAPAQEGEGGATPVQEGDDEAPVQEGDGGQAPVQEGDGGQAPAQEGDGGQAPAQDDEDASAVVVVETEADLLGTE